MKAALSSGLRQNIVGQLKLGQLAALSEAAFADEQRELEQSRLFELLKAAGVIHFAEFSRARFAAKQFAGYGLKISTAGSGLSELINGHSDTVELIQRVGEEKFEKWFLKSEASDIEAAEECDLTLKEVKKLRDFVDKVYIQAEFDHTDTEPETAPPAQTFSAVAGIAIENGVPVLAFFNREIWKGRYAVDEAKLSQYMDAAPSGDAREAKSVVGKLNFFERRKTTLYGLLEILLELQKDYFITGEPQKRKAITQRELAKRLDVDASVLNRLVSNKSVQLPWGLEAPLDALIPSSKDVGKELLFGLLQEYPDFSDNKLCALMKSMHGLTLSRRSIAQYRHELSRKKR